MIPYFSMEKATVLSNTFSFVFRMVWRRLWGALTLYTVSNERLPQWNRVLWCSRRWHFAILIVSSSHVHTHLDIPSVKKKLMSKYSRLLSQGIFVCSSLQEKKKKMFVLVLMNVKQCKLMPENCYIIKLKKWVYALNTLSLLFFDACMSVATGSHRIETNKCKHIYDTWTLVC